MKEILDETFWRSRPWWQWLLWFVLFVVIIAVIVQILKVMSPDLVTATTLLFYGGVVILFLTQLILYLFGFVVGIPPLVRVILGEDGHVSLSRFQFFFWTIVLGGAFLFSVFSTGHFPAWNEVLLLAMGITASGLMYGVGNYFYIKDKMIK